MAGQHTTHIWLSELQSSIDVSNSGKQKQVEVTQTFLQWHTGGGDKGDKFDQEGGAGSRDGRWLVSLGSLG